MPRYKLRKDLVRKFLRGESLRGKTCLEFGYGAGDMLLLFAELGLTVYGFDFSEEAYRSAGFRIADRPVLQKKISLCRDESEIHARHYDYIMAFEVLEHIEDDTSCLKKWRELLNDSGKLLISVPAHMSKWGPNDFGHYRRYERDGMSRLLWQSGFRILHFWNYAYPISILLDVFLNKKRLIEQEHELSNEELAKLSGITRKKNVINRILAGNLLMYPFVFLQRLFLNYDFSSAYLIIGEKRTT